MSLNQHIKGSLDLGNPLMSYTCIVDKPDSAVEYYEAYKNIGRKYTRIAYGTNASMVIQATINALMSGMVYLKEIQKPDNITVPVNIILIEDYQGKRTVYTSTGRTAGFPSLPQLSPVDFKTNLPSLRFIYPHEACRFEDVALWTNGTGATHIADTVNFKEGKQGIKVASTSTTYSGYIDRSGLSLDLSQRHFHFWLYIHNIENLYSVILYFATASWENYYAAGVDTTQLLPGWNYVSFTRPKFIYASGSPSWSNITGIRFVILVKTEGVAAEVTLDDFKAHLDEYTGKVMLRFDDSYHRDTVTIAKPYMDKYGFGGVHACIINQIGGSGALTLPDLKMLQDSGWDIVSHTLSHPYLTQISLDKAEKELFESQRWLLNNGFIKGARFFVPPYHDYNIDVLELIKKYYVLSSGVRDGGAEGFAIKEHPYLLRAESLSSPPWNWTTIKGLIDRAKENNQLLTLLIHRVDESVFSTLVDYLYTEGIEVLTFSDLVDNLASYKNRLKSSGTATISASTTVTFNHGLAGTPTHINVGFKTTGYGSWIWSADATNITITVAVSGTYDLTWDAEYKP